MSRQGKAYAYGLAAVLAWSTVATAFKISLEHLTPAQLVLYASTASFLVLLGVLAAQRRLPELACALRRHWKRSLLLGAVNPFVYYLVLFRAYDLLPAQEAQAINYTWALTMTLLAIPLLKQTPRRADVVAALVCYLGVLVIATRGEVLALHFSNFEGLVYALASTLLWAGYWIFNAKDEREPVIGLALNFGFALPMALVWCLLGDGLGQASLSGLLGAAYVGAFEMGLTFVAWLMAMKLTESTARIANLIFLSPLLSLALIHLIVGETIYPSTFVGLALILGGLALQKWLTRAPAAAA
ncbi:drug/metabolite transporter (DMT)-like permease [Crenobacter luteus]|uniref:DMT family transporter n=1 Tax=Crenobacter luteus TaxID=1452487 RepID=UPI001052F1C7|nr:DMT family transporter [Crenobacter luteus]TCP15569.1 drug/metabolite transporter (DMT)-like permease [Crenobacter luteus]